MIALRTADEKGSGDNIDDFSVIVPDGAVQRQAGNLPSSLQTNVTGSRKKGAS